MNLLKWVVFECLVSGAQGSLTSNVYSKCSGLNSPWYQGSSGFSAGLCAVLRGKNIHFPVIVLLPGVKMPHAVQDFVKDIMLPKGSKMEWNLTRLVPPRVCPAQNSGLIPLNNGNQSWRKETSYAHICIFMKCLWRFHPNLKASPKTLSTSLSLRHHGPPSPCPKHICILTSLKREGTICIPIQHCKEGRTISLLSASFSLVLRTTSSSFFPQSLLPSMWRGVKIYEESGVNKKISCDRIWRCNWWTFVGSLTARVANAFRKPNQWRPWGEKKTSHLKCPSTFPFYSKHLENADM